MKKGEPGGPGGEAHWTEKQGGFREAARSELEKKVVLKKDVKSYEGLLDALVILRNLAIKIMQNANKQERGSQQWQKFIYQANFILTSTPLRLISILNEDKSLYLRLPDAYSHFVPSISEMERGSALAELLNDGVIKSAKTAWEKDNPSQRFFEAGNSEPSIGAKKNVN